MTQGTTCKPPPPLDSLKRPARAAFTLIEMSIALVIIALLVGGVVAGRELIEQSRIRQVGAQVTQMESAVLTFRDKFKCLPGDCPTATSFWGLQTSPACSSSTVSGYSVLTCNGNGNGAIGIGNEITRAFQHLSNAELVPEKYWGSPPVGIVYSPCDTFNDWVKGRTLPETAIAPGIITINALTTHGSHEFRSGIITHGAFYESECGAYSGQQTMALDKKIDDGMPNTGKMRSYWRFRFVNGAWIFNNACTQGATSTSPYSTSTEPLSCGFSYRTAF